jgi:hypothetical protein
MILISNHVKDKIIFSNSTVVRINIAWMKDYDDLINNIIKNSIYDIFLDFPEKRRKPPLPILTFDEIIPIFNKYKNIKYFAISNSEDIKHMEEIRDLVPSHVKIVPKIETEKGIRNLLNIVRGAQTNIIMLDKEDVYMSVNADGKKFNKLLDILRSEAVRNNIEVLELQGVIFYSM